MENRKPNLKLKSELLYQSNIFNRRAIIYKDLDGNTVSQRVILTSAADKAMVYNVWVHVLDHLKPHIKDAYNDPYFDYDSLRNIPIEIPVKDFKFSKDYKRIKKACMILFGMAFRFYLENDRLATERYFNAFSEYKEDFIKKNGVYHLRLSFSYEALKFLVDFTRGYTSINKQEILKLKTFYSKRIYEWLCQFKGTGFFKIREQDFRGVLGLTGKYKTLYHLKKFVLDPSVACIKSTTVFKDLSFEIEGGKHSGRVFVFKFSAVKLIDASNEQLDYKNQFSRILLTYVFRRYMGKLDTSVFRDAIDYIRSHTPLRSAKMRKEFVSRVKYLEEQIEAKKRHKNELYALTNWIIEEDFHLNIAEVKNKFFNKNKQGELF